MQGFAQWLSQPQPMDPQANISSGNWPEEWHEQLNAKIRKLIGKQETDVTGQYQIEKQKEEINVLLQEFRASLSSEEENKWDNIIAKSNWEIGNTEGLFKELNTLLSNKKTLFFYLKPSQSIFYLKREALPPLIAEAHFGHARKSKTDRKDKNHIYIAEPSYKLKTYEGQQAIILHELIHLIIGAGEEEHNFAQKLQIRFERNLLEKQIPADFLKEYRHYYELKNEILKAEKANDNNIYQKKRQELIETADHLRTLIETVSYEQFKQAFDLLRINQIENQEDVALRLGTFDEFYHLSTPEYNHEEIAVFKQMAREMAEGLKNWHNPDEIFDEVMSAIKPYHIKYLLPESIDEKNKLKRKFLSLQIKNVIEKVFAGTKDTKACFTRGLETTLVLTKGLRNRDSSLSLLKGHIKHEFIGHYFPFKGIIPLRYEREDISTAITTIEVVNNEGMEAFNKHPDYFIPVAAQLFQAGSKLQQEGKVFLDEDYLLKKAFEIFTADERLEDIAIMLVRDPAGRNAEETAALNAQANDMRQRVIGVIMAGALMQHSKESKEPVLETLIEFFKVLSEKAQIPRVEEVEAAIAQAEELGVTEKGMLRLNELLNDAKQRKNEVAKTKTYILNWAKGTIGKRDLTYAEAAVEIPQWIYLPEPQTMIVGVEDDLYNISRAAAYGLVVPPVFEAKYGAIVREKIIEDEFRDNPHFNLLLRIMDTPRIMAFGWHSYQGTVDWVKAAYEERFREENLLVAQTLLNRLPRPAQYLDSFIYRWYKEIDRDGRLKNKEVRQAMDKTRAAYRKVMETIKPEEIYQIVRDEIWPEYKKLIDDEITERKEMEQFKREHQGINPSQVQQMWDAMSDAEKQAAQKEFEKRWKKMSDQERQKIIDEAEKQIQEAVKEYLAQASRAQQGGKRSSQSPAMPGRQGAPKTSLLPPQPSEGKPSADEIENMNQMALQLQRMAERVKEKAESLSQQSNQAGQSASEMGMEAAQKAETVGKGKEDETGEWNWDEGEKPGAKPEPEKEGQDQEAGKPEEGESSEEAETGSKGKDSEQGGKSSWDIDDTADGDAAEAEPLKGLNSLAQEAKNKNQVHAGEYDLSQYLEEEPEGPTEEEISPRTDAQITEHNKTMAKRRKELFFKQHKLKFEDHQGYQIRNRRLMPYIVNVKKELKSMLIPGSGSDFLRARSQGEIDDDALPEIPAGTFKIFGSSGFLVGKSGIL